MSYDNSSPKAAQLISVSQSIIQGNFAAIDSGTTGATDGGFARNHVSLSDGTNPGVHYQLEFASSVSDPTSSGTTYSAIYPKTGTTYSEPYFLNDNLAGQVMWYGGTGSGGATATFASNGALNLPNGIQFRWGTATIATSSTTVTYSTPFTTTSGTYNVQLSVTANAALASGTYNIVVIDNASSITASKFNAIATRSLEVNYFAIGH